ncbi:hypothetical protein M514_02125 [Trichuris suis]|uniref:Uncharacterized protein n=1 Tax=Trichuris suis TaxID=68888 RepID=A0A085MI22_9BILA|nr:hypothetical protein M513_02125 [Trichuris suis]KFD61710.1 hypothetical protein M514_02125 [Trichuris suis]
MLAAVDKSVEVERFRKALSTKHGVCCCESLEQSKRTIVHDWHNQWLATTCLDEGKQCDALEGYCMLSEKNMTSLHVQKVYL